MRPERVPSPGTLVSVTVAVARARTKQLAKREAEEHDYQSATRNEHDKSRTIEEALLGFDRSFDTATYSSHGRVLLRQASETRKFRREESASPIFAYALRRASAMTRMCKAAASMTP